MPKQSGKCAISTRIAKKSIGYSCLTFHYFYLYRLSFGWYRAEVIGALLSVLMIWVVTAILFYLAVLRTINKDFELNGEVMLVTSGLGILVNIM